jgi:hypothetical protein
MATKITDPIDATTTNHAQVTEETNQKVTEYIEQLVATQKKLALAAIDSYQDTVLRFVDSYEKAVADSNIDWLKETVAPQAAASRELTTAYVKAARQLVN